MSGPLKSGPAAADLGVSKSWLDKDRARGGKRRVPFRRVGRAVLYDRPDLEAYKRANRVAGSTDPDSENTAA